jgi:hypothetical protein
MRKPALANNICIQKIETFGLCNGSRIGYIVVLRNNYNVLRICKEHSLLKKAVDSARTISKIYKIPLCCSCSLLGRKETQGLKMF